MKYFVRALLAGTIAAMAACTPNNFVEYQNTNMGTIAKDTRRPVVTEYRRGYEALSTPLDCGFGRNDHFLYARINGNETWVLPADPPIEEFRISIENETTGE